MSGGSTGTSSARLQIDEAAAEVPEQLALITEEHSLTFAQLAQRVAIRRGWLRDHGVLAGTERPVAFIARAELATVELVYALISLGVQLVPLHPAAPAAFHADQSARSGARLLTVSAADTSARPAEPASTVEDESTLAIVFTSGTSGTSKGVKLSRRAFLASARAHAANLPWSPEDRWLLSLPPAHIGGLSVLIRCLIARRAVVLAPGSAGDASALSALIQRHQVTLLSLVPTQLYRLVQHPQPAKWSSLRGVFVGGAPVAPRLLQQARDLGLPVLATYGMTEACSQVATERPPPAARGLFPLPGVKMRVVGDVLEISGDTLCSGYVSPHEPNVVTTGSWFPTQDLASVKPSGELVVFGRSSDLIISGGENILASAVGSFLEALEFIEAACVFAEPDEEWGQVLCAALVPARSPASAGATEVPLAKLRAALTAGLPRFQWPRRIAWLDSLFVGPTGKVDRRRTSELARKVLQDL